MDKLARRFILKPHSNHLKNICIIFDFKKNSAINAEFNTLLCFILFILTSNYFTKMNLKFRLDSIYQLQLLKLFDS